MDPVTSATDTAWNLDSAGSFMHPIGLQIGPSPSVRGELTPQLRTDPTPIEPGISISLIDAIGRSGFFSQAGSDPALARTAVIESGTERLQVRKIDSSSTSGIDELEEQAERENRDRGNEFHCHPLLQLSARLPVKEVRGMPSSKKAASSVFSERPRMQRALSQTQGVWDMAWSLAYECEERASLLASRLKLHLQARLESKGTWVRSNNPTLACLPEPALHTDFRWFLVLVRFSSSSSKALHSQELARCGNIVQSSSSEPSVNQGPERNGADAGPSGTPSSSSWEEDSFGLRVLEESSYGTDTSREGPLEQAAIPFPPANPVASPEAAQEALPQAPAPAEVAHPVPNQEEVAALRRELHVLIQEQIRAESERGRGPLSTQFPEQREFNSEAAHNLMAQLELSGETDTDSLREWAERIRGDPSLLKPLIVDYLPQK
ncbi:unnamed protein product [Dovyalis caffra]|uniref:Uncharacterized protein n=1 Tax=Dovyalis caffra TaxID=77055 RepID=A0AAV1QT71_9ROSI|nr:unnamed protein product [Dovyalis caffra]CAK7328731.1 unnamed protein product [Dovyalis caffra]